MRISFSSGIFYHRGLGYSLDLARDLGFDGVELVLNPEYMYLGIERVVRVARSSPVPILSVHPPFFPLPGWPRRVGERTVRLTTAAHLLGTPIVVVHAPSIIGPHTPRARRYTAALHAGQAATGNNVEIAIENNQYGTRSTFFHFDDLQALVDYARDQGCGITFDTCHAGANGEDLLACYEIVRPVLRNVHLSDVLWRDGRPVTHRLPGVGALPLGEFLSVLARDSYDGLITLEIHPKQMSLFGRAQHADKLAQALAFVRQATALPSAAVQPEAST